METIKWHPYPKEKPKKGKTYLVTYKEFDTGNLCVDKCLYYVGWFTLSDVTAWAELPKPYEEGAEDDENKCQIHSD